VEGILKGKTEGDIEVEKTALYEIYDWTVCELSKFIN
jgi:hypothetical protein